MKEKSALKKIPKMDNRIIRLSLAVLIVLIPNLLYPNYYIFLAFNGIPLLLAGFLSSILSEGKFKDGILNGVRVGLFSGLTYLLTALFIFLFNQDNITGFTGNIAADVTIFIVAILTLFLLTSLGGLIGSATRILLTKKELYAKKEKTAETTIIESRETVESTVEYKYRDEMVNLGYKQYSALTDGEQIFKSLLSHSITEVNAIDRLKYDKKILDEVLTEMGKITPPDQYQQYHRLKISALQDLSETFAVLDGLVVTDPIKIQQTKKLVESSIKKIIQGIRELQKTMQDEYGIKNLD